jgi:hypothetical protein
MGTRRSVVIAAVLVLGGAGSRARAGGEPCKLATKGNSPVAQACAKNDNGGVRGAKKVMKEMRIVVNKGRSEKFECMTCHDKADDDRYDTLTKDGRERFKDFVAEYEKKK